MLFNAFAGWASNSGIMQGVAQQRFKGGLKKFVAAVKGKIWPVLRPLLSVATSVLPGPANLIAQRLLTPNPTVDVSVGVEAKATGDLVQLAGPNTDAFYTVLQYHVCQLDEAKQPIVVDTMS